MFYFSDEKKILPGLDSELPVLPQDVSIVMKSKHPIHIIVFGVVTSDGDIISPFIFSHGLRRNTETNIFCVKKVGFFLDREGDRMSGNRILPHVTQAGECSFGW